MELAKIIDSLSYIKDLDPSSQAIIAADAALLLTFPCVLGFKNAVLASLIVDAAISGMEYNSHNQLPKIITDAKDALSHGKDWAISFLVSNNNVAHDTAPVTHEL